MNQYTLERRLVINRPLEQVFSFFARPENLELLTPRRLQFQMLTPSPIPMREGALVDYVIRLFGASFRWTTCITEFNPPHAFVDVQLRGPYSFWHHTHKFHAAGNGTLVTDEVRYAMPFGLLGRAVHRMLVHRQLDEIFTYRERRMKAIFDEVADPSARRRIRSTEGKTL